jgi:hypothetical protein
MLRGPFGIWEMHAGSIAHGAERLLNALFDGEVELDGSRSRVDWRLVICCFDAIFVAISRIRNRVLRCCADGLEFLE